MPGLRRDDSTGGWTVMVAALGRRLQAVALATAVVLVLGGLVAVASANAEPAGLSFSQVAAIPVPPGATSSYSSEPRLLDTSSGTILVSAMDQPYDCSTGKLSEPSQSPDGTACVWTSTDGGASFHIDGGVGPQAFEDVDLAEPSPGVWVESVLTRTDGLLNVLGPTVGRTTNAGKQWSVTTDANRTAEPDRDFLLPTGVPGHLLLVYSSIPLQSIWASASTDGAASFGASQPISPQPGESWVVTDGGPATDSYRHQLIVPYEFGPRTCNPEPGLPAGSECMNEIRIARSSDRGATWTSETAVVLGSGRTLGKMVIGSAADGAGHEYVVFSEIVGNHENVYVSESPGRGAPWSTPQQVDPPGGTAMLGWPTAAGDGGLAIAYYHSSYPDARSTNRPWQVQIGVSHNAGRTFSYSTVGGTAFTGSVENHDAVLHDAIQIAVDRTGMLDLVWTANHSASPSTNLTSVQFARQVGGPPLGVGPNA